MSFTGTGVCGPIRFASIHRGLPPRHAPDATVAPICPSAPGQGAVSAELSPCSRPRPCYFLAKARFELPEGEVPVPLARITLRPKQGLKLKVTMLHLASLARNRFAS